MSPRCVFGLSAAWRGTHGGQRQSPAVSRVSSSRAVQHTVQLPNGGRARALLVESGGCEAEGLCAHV
eukprot:scaffold107798_cov36-Phaeocystis_antarctica.AAC.1